MTAVQPGTVRLTRPRHPFDGRQLPVLGSMRRHGAAELLVVLPDGSKRLIPAAWTDLGPAAGSPQAITTLWYATAGHDPADIEDRRAAAPWYRSKTRPATADMAAKLRRVIIAARFKATRPDQPTPQEMHAIRLAWDTAAA